MSTRLPKIKHTVRQVLRFRAIAPDGSFITKFAPATYGDEYATVVVVKVEGEWAPVRWSASENPYTTDAVRQLGLLGACDHRVLPVDAEMVTIEVFSDPAEEAKKLENVQREERENFPE